MTCACCHRKTRRRRGMFLIDALVGMAIVAILMAVLATAVHHHRTGAARLAERRAALRAAEAALLQLQGGEPIAPAESADPQPIATTITPLDDPSPAPEMRWVAVRSTYGARSVELVGLVPKRAIRPSDAPTPVDAPPADTAEEVAP